MGLNTLSKKKAFFPSSSSVDLAQSSEDFFLFAFLHVHVWHQCVVLVLGGALWGPPRSLVTSLIEAGSLI